MRFQGILKEVGQYYSDKIAAYGATARGADWNSPESQALRFEQLLKVLYDPGCFSLNDYGCGYGALVQCMTEKNLKFIYTGFDIATPMIAKAKELYEGRDDCKFFTDEFSLTVADYTVASGVFNVRLQVSDQEWEKYVLHTVGTLANLSSKGFAFNMLTKYSDPDRKRTDLYYADPQFMFDYCKRELSRFVSLLHDYPLFEFTILVKK